MLPIEVSCLCGDVRLHVAGEPMTQFYCHCDDCQAVHGAAYIGVAAFPSSAVTVERGEPTLYTYNTMPRARCGVCGAMLFAHVPGSSLTAVKANLLPAGMFDPKFHIHCRYAVLPVIDDLPHYKSLPKVFGGSDELIGW